MMVVVVVLREEEKRGGGVSGTRIIRQLRDACDTCVAFDDVKLLEFFVGALHLIVGL